MTVSKTDSTQLEKVQPPTIEDEFELLCKEAHGNAQRDRVALKNHLSKLRKMVVENIDTAIVMTDAITKTAEALSKSNLQIIQIAQLKMKSNKKVSEENPELFSESDTDKLYDDIKNETPSTTPEVPN